MHGFVTAIVFILFIATGSPLTFAQDLDDLLPDDAWRKLSNDRTIQTSTCIGSNESPECLAESWLACQLWDLSWDYIDESKQYDPEVCRTTPGMHAGRYGGRVRYEPEAVYHYKLDVWRLSEEDAIWRTFLDVPGGDSRVTAGDFEKAKSEVETYRKSYSNPHYILVEPGDTVVDIFVRSFSPEVACMNSIGKWKATVPAAVCPRTSLFDHFWVRRPGHLVSSFTLFLRRVSGSWQIVNTYGEGAFGRDPIDQWRPDHWKVK